MIRTLPFLSKSYLACEACREPIRVTGAQARRVAAGTEAASLAARLEEIRRASKNEVQRSFLLAQRQPRRFDEPPSA